jgi:hypothetical protein
MKEEEIKELFEQFEAIANEYKGIMCKRRTRDFIPFC